MRFLDDKKRLFGIVNPIDGVVIAVVLVGAVLVGNLLFGVNAKTVNIGAGRGKGTVEMTVKAESVRDFGEGDISTGDKVTRDGGASVMGNVESVRSQPATAAVMLPNGILKEYEDPATKDIYLTIRGQGALTPDGAFMGDEQVRVNQEFQLLAPRWEGKAHITSLKVVTQ